MGPSRFRTAVAAAIRSSTGTWSRAMWPPMKLYLGKPFHLRAGAGVSGARRGATSKGAVMGGSSWLLDPIAGPSPPDSQQLYVVEATARNEFASAMAQGWLQRGGTLPVSRAPSSIAG